MTEERYQRELVEVARPYWAAEAEITRRFFANKPAKEDWIYYLKAAVYKELNPVIGYGPTEGYACGLHMEFRELVDRFDRLDRDVDRRAFYDALKMMTEEFHHYVVLAEVLEYLLGRKLTPEDPVQLSEDKKLNEMRRAYVELGEECLKRAMGLTEGGGSSTFREGAKLKGGEIEDRIASAMKVIYVDEKDHYEEAAMAAARAVRSEDDLARMKEAIREVSIQRVAMRNEMFRDPMTQDEIDGVVAKNAS